MNFAETSVITFDCYGTLVDWESGILDALHPLLAAHDCKVHDREILEMYARLESDAQRGTFRPYRDILRQVVRGFGQAFGFTPSRPELHCLEDSLPNWPVFPDTVHALRTLGHFYRLGIISNIDDDLFAGTAARLGCDFDWVVTAEQVQSYKPQHNNFERALERIGLLPGQIVHAAQSVYHDIVPARQLGWPCVWVQRRYAQRGNGATPPAAERADWVVPDLQALAQAACSARQV